VKDIENRITVRAQSQQQAGSGSLGGSSGKSATGGSGASTGSPGQSTTESKPRH
jgi:hypothetical protein